MKSEAPENGPSSRNSWHAKHSFRIAVMLCVLASIPRILLQTTLIQSPRGDNYWDLAQSVKNEFEFVVRPDDQNPPQTEFDMRKSFYFDNVPTAHRLPATPILLAILLWISGDSVLFVTIIHAILTSMVSVVAYLTLRNVGKPDAGVLAGILWALWPYSVLVGLSLMSEPLALYCMATLIYLSTLKTIDLKIAIMAGIVVGISVANRSESLLFGILYLISLGILKKSWRKYLILIVTITALIQLPWLYRNYRMFGRPVMNNLSGFVLWIGNNPWTQGFYDYHFALNDPQMKYVSDRFPDLWQVDEATRCDYFKRATMEYLTEMARSNPARIVSLYGWKALYFFALPTYFHKMYAEELNWKGLLLDYSIPIFLIPFKMMFLYCLFRKRPDADEFFFVLPFVFIFAISTLAFPTTRYEYAYDIGMILFIASRCSPWLTAKLTSNPSIAGRPSA